MERLRYTQVDKAINVAEYAGENQDNILPEVNRNDM
jgi:hypothetical protein